jgi:hypothetical protein
VACGASPADACAPGRQCCLDLSDHGHCVGPGDPCAARAALCDGSEDCQSGDRCCADGNTAFCDATCRNYACQDAVDCPASAPNCCPDPETPWGAMLAVRLLMNRATRGAVNFAARPRKRGREGPLRTTNRATRRAVG